MSDTLESMRRKISRAGELQSVVRTMKALAASSVGQYERAVRSLEDYCRAVDLGLGACLRELEAQKQYERNTAGHDAFARAGNGNDNLGKSKAGQAARAALIIGSDQGLVGQFNESLADFALHTLKAAPGGGIIVWTVGERIQARLEDARLPLQRQFATPNSVAAITRLIGEILVEMEERLSPGGMDEFHIFHNRPKARTLYEPATRRLLPLDESWRQQLISTPWPTRKHPEMVNGAKLTLQSLLRQYLFISMFRSCAESLAAENACRLAAMQRAEKNIEEMLEELGRAFHRLRQDAIDAELFDVVAGFEAMHPATRATPQS